MSPIELRKAFSVLVLSLAEFTLPSLSNAQTKVANKSDPAAITLESDRSKEVFNPSTTEVTNDAQILAYVQAHLRDYGTYFVMRVENGKLLLETEYCSQDGQKGKMFLALGQDIEFDQNKTPLIRFTSKDINDQDVPRFISLYEYLKTDRELISKLPKDAFDEVKKLVDQNRDGYFSEAEFGKAFEYSVTGKQSQIITAFELARTKIQVLVNDEIGFENDGITKNDVEALFSPSNKDLLGHVEGLLTKSASALGLRPISLYGYGGYPSPYDGAQYTLGNCYVISAFNAVAAARPEVIQRAIKPLNNQPGYYVHLSGFNTEVPIPSDSELTSYTICNSSGGYWKAVLLKAYGRGVGENFIFKRDSDEKYTDDGGSCSNVLRALTGQKVEKISLRNLTNEQLHEILASAQTERRAYCFSTGGVKSTEVGEMKIHPIHAYAGLSYNPDTKLVSMMEPRRSDIEFTDDPRIGTANLNLDQIKKYFNTIDLEIDCAFPAPQNPDKSKMGFSQKLHSYLRRSN